MKDYSAECDASTLMEAAMIKADKSRYSEAMNVIEKKKKAINSIDGLKERFNEAVKKESEEEEEEKGINIKIELSQKESLMTEEDKAQIQADNEWEKNQEKLKIK